MRRCLTHNDYKSFMKVIGKILTYATEKGGMHKLSKEYLIYYDQLTKEVEAFEASRLKGVKPTTLSLVLNFLRLKRSPFIGMNIFFGSLQTNNNEFGWRPRDVVRVVRELQRMGNAILGGEVWIVVKGSNVRADGGNVRSLEGYEIACHEKYETESWNEYVRNSAIEYLKFFRETKDKPGIEAYRKEYKGDVFFEIEFLNEAKYTLVEKQIDKWMEEHGDGEGE